MNRVLRTASIISALLLIYFDIGVFLINGNTETGALTFSTFFNYCVPCGALFGIAIMCRLFEKPAQKAFLIAASICAGIAAIIRIIAFILQITFIANGTGKTGIEEYFSIGAFLGLAVLMVSVVLFSVFLMNGKFKKASLTVFGIGAILVAAQKIADVIFTFNNFSENSSATGIWAFITTCLTPGYIYSVLSLLAYTSIFAYLSGAFENET